MTKKQLNALIAEKLLGIEPCPDWRRVWYRDQGAVLLRDAVNCRHREGLCYSEVELVTFIGVMGGPPQYAENSRAGLVLLRELSGRADSVILQGSGPASWSLTMYRWRTVEGWATPRLVTVAGPAPARTPELAIALTAAELAGVTLSAAEISD